RMQRLDYLSRRLTHPGERIRNQAQHLQHLASRLRGAWRREWEGGSWRMRELARRFGAARPDLESLARTRDDLARRLREAAHDRLKTATTQLKGLESHLKHLNPRLVLERGYSITESADGKIVRDSSMLVIEEDIKITLAKGWVGAQVKRKG
ncbi:MAG: hypothetical protein K2Y16_03185, partial [Burkholderiales bacterium]|nr:hypothetical protein [Burkholderiales bacterium]